MSNPARNDKRDLILSKGAQVMTRRGYHGTGVQEIVQAAGIPKGSFYHYFASKEDFACRRWSTSMRRGWSAIGWR